MSPRQRQIDRWPEPETRRAMKLLVVSCSRTGTLGLYEALGILGYHPYHMVKALAEVPHMLVTEEAVTAHHNRYSGIQPYGRKEFDKWLADYDALIEIPSYLGTDAIKAYLADPDVKFILTERDPDSWVRSFNKFVAVQVMGNLGGFPISAAKYFDTWLSTFSRVNGVLYNTFSRCVPYRGEGNEEVLRREYVSYIESVKKTIPPERLCVIKLEDGLGWEQICPYLEKEIPDQPYPDGRGHEALVKGVLAPIINGAVTKMAAAVLPALGVGAWLAVKNGPWLVKLAKGIRS